MTSFSLGLHQKLVNSGVDPRSDEYFEQIDARMRSVFPDFFGSAQSRPSDNSKRPATVVAPGARSTGVRKVQLTETQVALARKFGLTPQQYAAEIAKLAKTEN
jgi:3,4-dihydroxy-2-butanone 4-phosphate synthase